MLNVFPLIILHIIYEMWNELRDVQTFLGICKTRSLSINPKPIPLLRFGLFFIMTISNFVVPLTCIFISNAFF